MWVMFLVGEKEGLAEPMGMGTLTSLLFFS